MPTITDAPPALVQAEIGALSAALAQEIPAKTADNLLVATWNIRAFSSLTDKWTAASSDSPKRDLRGLLAIKEVISRFDVVAVQEVQGNLRALYELTRGLGDSWTFLMTDINYDTEGNDERMAFVFDRSRVEASGLAGELMVPPEWLADPTRIALRRQFARAPYAVSFRSGSETVILVTVHIDYGNSAADRIDEIQGIADWLYYWAGRSFRHHHNLILLGDLNVDRMGNSLWEALVSRGLVVPDDLLWVPRTIFADPGSPTTSSFHDHVAWFQTGSRRRLTLDYTGGGSFDFVPHMYGDLGLSMSSLSYRMSDHYPLWVEFAV